MQASRRFALLFPSCHLLGLTSEAFPPSRTPEAMNSSDPDESWTLFVCCVIGPDPHPIMPKSSSQNSRDNIGEAFGGTWQWINGFLFVPRRVWRGQHAHKNSLERTHTHVHAHTNNRQIIVGECKHDYAGLFRENTRPTRF